MIIPTLQKSAKIRRKGGSIRADTNEIQGIIKEYSENLYSNTLESLEETDKCSDICDLRNIYKEHINTLNWSIISNEIEATIVS